MLDDDTASEKNTSPLDPKVEERHAESVALVGHYVQVRFSTYCCSVGVCCFVRGAVLNMRLAT